MATAISMFRALARSTGCAARRLARRRRKVALLAAAVMLSSLITNQVSCSRAAEPEQDETEYDLHENVIAVEKMIERVLHEVRRPARTAC